MKYLFYLVTMICFGQTKPTIETTFISKTLSIDKSLKSIDNLNATYYVLDNSLIKKTKDVEINYNNFQLGKIESVNTFNPLKINAFFKDFNTVIILDNRLTEIYKIDFNANKYYKNISHISTGYDNTLWVFNYDTQQLELIDYKANTTKTSSLPLVGEVLDITSNYNYCWLLTDKYLYKFNYFGINIFKLKNSGFNSIDNLNENLIIQKDDKLFYLKNNSSDPIEIRLPKLLINDFFVNNETLYIYDNEFLYKYQLKIN